MHKLTQWKILKSQFNDNRLCLQYIVSETIKKRTWTTNKWPSEQKNVRQEYIIFVCNMGNIFSHYSFFEQPAYVASRAYTFKWFYYIINGSYICDVLFSLVPIHDCQTIVSIHCMRIYHEIFEEKIQWNSRKRKKMGNLLIKRKWIWAAVKFLLQLL